MNNENRQLLIRDLLKEGIRVIEVPPIENTAQATLHPLDSHPSSAEYEWVAEHLYKEITHASAQYHVTADLR